MAQDKIVIMDGEIHRTEKTYINDIEYIRKDALLEWAKSQMASYENEWRNSDIIYGGNHALDNLIRKIESL